MRKRCCPGRKGKWWFGLGGCLLTAWLAVSPTAWAQDEQELEEELEEEFQLLEDADVVYSASRHEQKVGLSPNAVVVITRKDIEASGAVSLMDLLRRWPVTRVYEFEPMYPTMEARLMYRILLLVDGREVNLDLFPAPLFAITPVDLQEIERIEIVLGPSSAIYGANAVSAVIQIFTRRPTAEPHTEASLRAGEHGTWEAEARVEGGTGKVSGVVFGGLSRADSWMIQSQRAKEVFRGGLRAELELGAAHLQAAAGLVHSQGRLFSSLGYLEDRGSWNDYADLVFSCGRFSLHGYWQGSRAPLHPQVELYYPPLGVTLGRLKDFYLRGDTGHGEAKLDLEPWPGNRLILGADVRYTRYHSTTFVQDTIDETRAGAFFHDEQRLGEKWLLQAGLRYDWNSRTDQALSPRGAVVFNPAGEHYLRLSAGLAFRKPSMMETAMNFEIESNPAFPEIKDLFEKYGLSDPDLGNELLGSVELGWKSSWWEGRLKTSIDGYAAFNRHVIGFRTDVVFDQTPLGPRLNLEKSQVGFADMDDDLDVYGVHLDLQGHPRDWLDLFLRADLRYGQLAERGYTRCVWYPRYLLVLGAGLRFGEGWHGQAAWSLVDGSVDVLRNPESLLAPSRTIELSGYNQVMLSLRRRFSTGPLELEAGLNFFDAFNNRFREEKGTIRRDGTNFGGEILGRRLVLVLAVRS